MKALTDAEVSGIVFNVQKYSVHDGPGIRTNVFLKGCPLRCRWCCNPESQLMGPELGYNADKCLRCGACIAACGHGALRFEDGFVALDKESCAFSELSCLKVCHAKALTVYGQRRSVGDILRQVELDEMFYSRSNGGLTVTGGEPLMQEVFLLALLREAGRRHIHRAMETSSLAPEPVVLRAAALLDYAMLDVKSLNEAKHLEYTGVSNRLILSNIQAMRREFPDLPMHIRTPVIPGFNDTEEDIRAIAGFAAALAPERYELLPYHYMGRQKYRFIGREYPMPEGGLDEDLFESLKELALRICPGVGVVEKPRDEIFVPDLLN